VTIQIAGFSDSVKIPGFFAETVYNAGAVTAGSIPLVLLVSGTMTEGTATPNQDVVDVFSSGDIDAACGAGSEIARMCYAALQTPGVTIKAAPTPEAEGSEAASAILAVGGSWTAGGTLNFRIDGVALSADALSTDTPATFATTIVNAILGNGQLSSTATSSGGVVTITRKSAGARGNEGALYVDTTLIPNGMTIGIAGGTSVTVGAGSGGQALPQKTISVATLGGLPTSGSVYDAALNTTITYVGTQNAPATAVAVGSNGVNVDTFTGTQSLDATTTGYPAVGELYIAALGVTIAYTATSGTAFLNCTTLYGGTGVLASGQIIYGTLLTGCAGGSGTLTVGDTLNEVVAMTGPGVRFTGGVGSDSVATLLANVIQTLQYDRIAAAQTDAVNAEAWATFVNAQAQPLIGITEHLVFGTNGDFATAVTIAQTDLNAERAQLLWENDGETVGSCLAATFGAIRTSVEQGDPDAAYDGYVLPGVAPQSQKSDWPNTNTLIAALNSGVTPVTTNAAGQPYVVRSITTHSMDEFGNPEYTTLDTSQAVVPDYVRLVLKLYFLTVFKPNNPRTGPDPAPTARAAPAGFATPMLWTQNATQQLMQLEQTSPPILLPGSTAANPVVSEWDVAGQRIMSVVPVVPCPNDHQLGVSVQNVTTV